MPRLNELPDEVILSIISHLETVKDLRNLQLICWHFFNLARDGGVWRRLCFESSIVGRRHNRATIPKVVPPRDVQLLQAEAAVMQSRQADVVNTKKQAKAQEMSKWDPRFDNEPVDWYREYVARQAPISLRWAKSANKKAEYDVEGIGLYKDSQGKKRAFLRFEDAEVGLWDVCDSASRGAKIIRGTHKPLKGGYSSNYDGIVEDKLSMSSSQIIECVSIDRARDKAYVAVDCQLNEIDLHTLQQSSCTTLPRPISALSNAASNLPLIVGTSSGLYRHDPRHSSRWFDGDQVLLHQRSLLQPQFAPGPHLPLSIVQSQALDFGNTPSEIYAAGRYPSVLVYDQRMFPKVAQSIWSGANLSSLSLIPQVLRQIPLQTGYSQDPNEEAAERPTHGHTILAAGAKNGKGSLEMYGFDRQAGRVVGSVCNRTVASRVKLLSVVSHGKRICTSDADGNVKWFERDAFNLVRQVNTNDLSESSEQAARGRSRRSPSPSSSSSSSSAPATPLGHGGLFGTRQDNGDVVQKLVPLSKAEDADLLLWAGGRAGLLQIGREYGEDEETEVLDEEEAKAREYAEDMRRLLEVQAVEARRMQNFGR